ncbi:MAG: electron transfer flavoprotein subunit alpha/FixB family protein, partial [Sphingobacteriales bacterium]
MSILIFIDQADGQVKKSSLEAISYGAKIGEQLNAPVEGVILGSTSEDLTALGKYGVRKIHHVNNELLNKFDAQVYTKVIAEVAQAAGSSVIIFSNNMDGKAIAPRLSARMKAGLVSGAVALPETSNGFIVKKNVFSGKAFANISVDTQVKIISLNANAYKIVEGDGTAEVVPSAVAVDTPKIKVTSTNKATGEIPLTEAEVVVSGGRGLKGPENWGMVEDLAKVLHAATACSRPVADSHWRPH